MTQNVDATLITRTPDTGTATGTQQQFNGFLERVMITDLNDTFFSGGEFNESCKIYHTSIGVWETYNVNFDDPSTTIDFGSDADLSDLKPQILIPNYILKAQISKKDKIIIRGKNYIIDDKNTDGVGTTTAYLTRR